MERFKSRLYLTLCLLCIFGSLIWLYNIQLNGKKFVYLSKLPLDFGPWKGKTEVVTENVKKILETDFVFINRYRNRDDDIWLAVVFYKDNQVGFHRPESCFGGLGRQVIDLGSKEIMLNNKFPKIKINQLKLTDSGGEKIMFYFYKIGDYYTNSYFKSRVRLLFDQLKFKRPGIALVEFYADIGNKSIEQTKELLEGFLANLISELNFHLSAN